VSETALMAGVDPKSHCIVRHCSIIRNNPDSDDFGRLASEASVRRLQAMEKAKRLAKMRIRLPEPIEAIVRRQRDQR